MIKCPQSNFCKFCEDEFEIKPTYPQQVYCSRRCSVKARQNKPSPYTIETICACGCGKTFLNPDDHYRYRKFLAEHRNAGGTHPRLGCTESEEKVIKRISKTHKRFKNKIPTCIELELYEFLQENNIEFEQQKQIGRTVPDAYISSINLCIYADGEYWHNKPEVIRRDTRITKQSQDKGFFVLRLKSINNGYNLDLQPLMDLYSGARP